jgi:hypothetical protein
MRQVVYEGFTRARRNYTVMAANDDAIQNADLTQFLGTRRAARLRRVMRQTGLPPEVLLDLAIELLDIASRKLAPPPIKRTAVGLGAARWRNVSPEERSEVLRKAAEARWAKHRGKNKD